MEDRLIVELPSREWAHCAVQDLAGAGCRAEVMPDAAPSGWSRLLIQGTPQQMAEIRAGMSAPAGTL